MLLRVSIVFILLAAVLVAPFALRPTGDEQNLAGSGADELVLISPHGESIQAEFGRAFVEYMRTEYNRDVVLDWRQPGGTSEIARFLQSEYTVRFENLWKEKTDLPFRRSIRNAFSDSSLDEAANRALQDGWTQRLPTLPEEEDLPVLARALFLESEIGAGIDLFFGGGAYDFGKQAALGTLVSADKTGMYGPAAIRNEHPDWFSDAALPQAVGGEPFRDEDLRWVGTVLSAFGICYNEDVYHRLGIDSAPAHWTDLSDPRLFSQIALADPTKSGSSAKAFEMLIQEQIHARIDQHSEVEDTAVRNGWDEGMRLILKISANSRYFTDSSAKVPRDVALGDAAAGMCIDFYGRTFNQIFQSPDGSSHVHFVAPIAGTSIGADPIGMLRGAPSPDLAHLFIEFVLSENGQKIWSFRPGEPGGPTRFALRRPPIRRDFYTPENLPHMSDPDVNPYDLAERFTYRAEWTGSLFSPLRFVIKSSCIDPHEEQQLAWKALIDAGMPPEGVRAFENVDGIDYETVSTQISLALRAKDKVEEVRLARELAATFRNRYLEIARKFGKN